MGEEFILFAAVVGVVLLLRGDERARPSGADAPAQTTPCGCSASSMVGGGVLVGLWLIAFGYITPGGGFQGGVGSPAGAILLRTRRRLPRSCRRSRTSRSLDPLEGIGAGGYVSSASAALVSGAAVPARTSRPREPGTLSRAAARRSLNWARRSRSPPRNVLALRRVPRGRTSCRSSAEDGGLMSVPRRTPSPPGSASSASTASSRASNLIHLALCLTVTQSSTLRPAALGRLLKTAARRSSRASSSARPGRPRRAGARRSPTSSSASP